MTKTSRAHPHFLRSVIRWLQVGYPNGVPGPDRVPLLALLRSTPLTEEQVKEVVRDLTADGSPATADGVINRDEIAEFISGVTHHDAGPENIQRVAGRLAAAGWPLAGIEVSQVIPEDEDAQQAEDVASQA
ncbi:DUF3349 domain-containing protein [Mycobacterium ostraviense]|uniref:Endonuclease n=1 Tax=Mycobacterium ostraviense TaxID=2738409 RepID=A0A164EAV2_9MYCO|nr:DUF3349 domain-containing protein [Mycobacterium ostraviense]KZS67264.1 hypothetical protein A4G28_21230 [Mycobacterium ostraviense]UGT90065.1 DUF3349 domain-containing protein [Mycobacterium ostraviense]